MMAHKKRMPLVAPASVPNGIRSLVHQSLEEQDWAGINHTSSPH